jgi:GxxExxY protein
MTELLYKYITYDIRGACFNVYKEFGGAFKEKVVERSLVIELEDRKRKVASQKRINIFYKDKKVGIYIPDIIVDDKVLLEIKCKEFATKQDIDQFWKYLKGSEYKVGLLINFGPKELYIKRVVYDTAREKQSATAQRLKSALHPRSAFTLIEIMLSLSLISIIAAITIPVYQSFQVRNDLDIGATTITQTMRRAQALSRASDTDTTWGVLATTTSITLFQGTNYAARDQSFDEVFDLPGSITSSGLSEVVFSRLLGEPLSTGTTTLTSTINETRTININTKGTISF